MTVDSEALELFVPGRLCLFGEHRCGAAVNAAAVLSPAPATGTLTRPPEWPPCTHPPVLTPPAVQRLGGGNAQGQPRPCAGLHYCGGHAAGAAAELVAPCAGTLCRRPCSAPSTRRQCHTEDVSQLCTRSSAATSCGVSVVCCHPCCLLQKQGLYARVRRLAEPLLRLRSTKDDGSVAEAEYPLDEALLAAVRAFNLPAAPALRSSCCIWRAAAGCRLAAAAAERGALLLRPGNTRTRRQRWAGLPAALLQRGPAAAASRCPPASLPPASPSSRPSLTAPPPRRRRWAASGATRRAQRTACWSTLAWAACPSTTTGEGAPLSCVASWRV